MHRRLATNYNLISITSSLNCMRAYAGIVIIISLLFLVGTVAAYIPDKITFTSNPEWLTANNIDQSTITVKITNQSNNLLLSSSTVVFTITDASLGTMNPLSVTTNLNGEASSNFNVRTKSGNATISVLVINGSDTNTFTIYQNIDHDSAYYDFTVSPPLFTYPDEGPVNKTVPFNVSIYDKWGNPVDNRNPKYVHNVSLHVSSALIPDDSYFVGYGQDILLPLDANGTLSVDIKLTTKSGINKVLMDTFEGKISTQIAWITAIAAGEPFSITGNIACIATGGICTANNYDYFIIDYVLFDEYGNPVRNRSIWVNTTPTNEQKKYTSNSLGRIALKYGPVVTAENITIDATSIDPPYVTNRTIAQFVNSAPTNMVLAVTPQNMASREVKPETVAYVRATVIDLFGNPVPNQLVSFDISAINTGGFNASVENGTPSFDGSAVVNTITATTDPDGNAIVLFYPGSFAQQTDPGFSNTASGTCIIKAQWGLVTRTTLVSWKNYPFLSVEAVAIPQNIRLNDTFDVIINVTGDGYAMPGGEFTAILDQDCSASMKNPDNNGHDRLWNAKEAAKAFVNSTPQGSYIGLISYGTENNNQFHLAPQTDLNLVKIKIDNLTQGTQSKNLSPSIWEAMYNITSTQYNISGPPHLARPKDKVRAVIVLNDGNSNIKNQGELDNLVTHATSQSPPIFIFTVLYLDGAPTNTNKQNIVQMGELANRTGGIMYIPTTPDELKNTYIGIAINLSKLAGVNATMEINYQTFEVDSQPMPGGVVFDYVPVGPFSPLQSAVNPDGRTSILWPNSSQSVINQTDEWNTYHQLHFDIGTLNISEQWQAKYRLKANQTGLIRLFDNRSSLSFNDGNDILRFPDLYITVTPNATPQQAHGILEISNLAVTKSGEITDYAPLEWNLLYTGFSTATETIWYSYNNKSWVQYDSRPGIVSGNYTHIRQLDVRGFPPGSYRIKVHGVAPDSNDDNETTEFWVDHTSGIVIILK